MTIERGFLSRPDGRVYYEIMGAGPAIIFAHGLGGNHLSWWQQMPHFAERHTCVAFAHRGFAPSDPIAGGPHPRDYVDDLEALIAHLALTDVRIVAQSMGGWSAVEYALRQPAALKGLVLAATSGTLDPRAADPAGGTQLDAWQRDAAAQHAALRDRAIHVAAGARMAMEQPAHHFLYASIDAINAQLDKEAVRQHLGETRVRGLDDARRIAVPTLFVTGAEDIVFPSFIAPHLAAAMPKGRAAQIAHAGHSAYFERPTQFNRLVSDFLAEAG
ncbi:alpha/beta hydrolase [Vineibacter terrae]|uniref:alpha/beta fold hydrolase n=1 Tax=Vineibacter terrae TaxID=2586908 RepID=UPI002E374F13|nr:alpha/beta hydrolase [Vineibacter terrae]HEX2888222.1 alpha/beta hydrolase [Vineibacter terrae]